MKILFFSHRFSPDIGGIEVNSELLASAFSKAGCEVHLVTWSKCSIDKTFPFTVVRNPNIFRLVKEHLWANVLFENNPCLRLSWPSFFLGRPKVVAVRTIIARKDGSVGYRDWLKFFSLRKAKAVIAVSEAIRETCWPNAIVVGNPYRVEQFKKLPISEERLGFVFLGRVVSQKGVSLAILAIQRLLGIYKDGTYSKDIFLTIIGDGPDRMKLERMVIDLNLTSYVTFAGSLSGMDLTLSLNRHRFLLVPSVMVEAFGNVALEGMACGCIPIVSDSGGLPDAVGNAGLVFKSGSLNSLVEKIQMILENPFVLQDLHNAASNHLMSHQPELVANKYLSIIKSVVSSKC